MTRLSSLKIRRFKQVQDATVSLGDITLLIGANNSGKSTVLQALHFALSVAQTAKLVGEGVSWRNDKFELSFSLTFLFKPETKQSRLVPAIHKALGLPTPTTTRVDEGDELHERLERIWPDL
jgi:AAA15 family ATPase/GTPase